MRTRHFLMLTILGLAAGGCQEPTQVITAAPPGVIPDRLAPPTDSGDNAPQALGEQPSPRKAGEDENKVARPQVKPALATKKGEVKTTAGGVRYETIHEGSGREVAAGDQVVFNYVGKFEDGKTFDQAKEAPFRIGVGAVIPGWDEAIVGMKVGEKRKLTIPPKLGYGERGQPPTIPPNSTLVFDVEVVGIK